MIRQALAIVLAEVDSASERVRRRLYAAFVSEIESRLRAKVEDEIKDRVRIAEEHRMVEKLCTFMRNAPGQTREGYIKLLRNGKWRQQPSWDWAPKEPS